MVWGHLERACVLRSGGQPMGTRCSQTDNFVFACIDPSQLGGRPLAPPLSTTCWQRAPDQNATLLIQSSTSHLCRSCSVYVRLWWRALQVTFSVTALTLPKCELALSEPTFLPLNGQPVCLQATNWCALMHHCGVLERSVGYQAPWSPGQHLARAAHPQYPVSPVEMSEATVRFRWAAEAAVEACAQCGVIH